MCSGWILNPRLPRYLSHSKLSASRSLSLGSLCVCEIVCDSILEVGPAEGDVLCTVYKMFLKILGDPLLGRGLLTVQGLTAMFHLTFVIYIMVLSHNSFFNILLPRNQFIKVVIVIRTF